jgi:LysM repeat protein
MVPKKVFFTICMLIILPFLMAELFLSPCNAASENSSRCDNTRLELWNIKSLMQRKDFLENAMQECPNDAMLQYYWAVNLDRRQRYKKALHYYQLSARLDKLFPYVYFGMGETYLSLGDRKSSIDAYRQGLKIQPDNKWGNNRVSQIAALKIDHDPSGQIRTKPVEKNQEKQALEEYTKNIAERYDIQLEGLVQAKEKMSDLKEIADRYDLKLDDLIQANRAISSEIVQVDTSLDGKTIKTEHENAQKKYLGAISKRYGIQLDELSKLNDQMSSIKSIADRYGISMDDLVRDNKQPALFENEKIYSKEHTVAKNEYLAQIANRYGVEIEDLVEANKQITDPHWIFPGQLIKIPEKE